LGVAHSIVKLDEGTTLKREFRSSSTRRFNRASQIFSKSNYFFKYRLTKLKLKRKKDKSYNSTPNKQ